MPKRAAVYQPAAQVSEEELRQRLYGREQMLKEAGTHADVRESLHGLSPMAVLALEDTLKNPEAKGRLAAAFGVLDRTGHAAERKVRLESTTTAPGDLAAQAAAEVASLPEEALLGLLELILQQKPGIADRLRARLPAAPIEVEAGGGATVVGDPDREV